MGVAVVQTPLTIAQDWCWGLQGGLLPKGAKGMRADELWDTQVLWEMQVLPWVTPASCQTQRAGLFSQLNGVSTACPCAPASFGNAITSQSLLLLALTAGRSSD